MDLIVVAKEPLPGRVKTRLCPPCSPAEAATVADAALADTLAAARATGADRVVLALDGRPGPWCPPGVEVVDQGSGGLDRRLTSAWAAAAAGPALLVGMDTPQVTAGALDAAMATLVGDGVDAVLGPATDGGWWAIGLRRRQPHAFLGVPMSRPDTGALQHARLQALGLRTRLLPAMTDVDTWPDALAVAETVPAGRFAAAVRALVAARQEDATALGVDPSPAAIDEAGRRRAPALRRSVFDPLPGERRWGTVLLLDGNVGIGGDPVVLLARAAALLRPGGLVVAEVDPPGTPTQALTVRIESTSAAGPWFPWARVGADAFDDLATRAGLRPDGVEVGRDVDAERWFARAVRP